MSATVDAPAAFRSRRRLTPTGRPGLIGEAVEDIRFPTSPGPLPRQGRQQEERLRHPPRQRLVDSRSPPPDGGLHRPRVGDLPERAKPAIPLLSSAAILPWKWFSYGGERRHRVGGRRPKSGSSSKIKFPKIVLPVAAAVGGHRQLPSSASIPLFTLQLLFYSDQNSARSLAAYPGDRRRPVRVQASRPTIAVVVYINVFFRDIANVDAARPCRLWFYLSPALYPPPSYDPRSRARRARSGDSPLLAQSIWVPLFESYRAVIYNETDAGLDGAVSRCTCSSHP